MEKEYDLIIVGSGLYGCVTAYLAHQAGWRCLVIEKRAFTGGNIRDEVREGINVHSYGPHVFHTRHQEVWDFASRFTPFNHFRYCPLARYGGKMYNLPFNMHTFYQLYGTQTPEEAALRLRQEQGLYPHPRNLEEKAVSMVGRTMYETLIKGYTEKQWESHGTPSIHHRTPAPAFHFRQQLFQRPLSRSSHGRLLTLGGQNVGGHGSTVEYRFSRRQGLLDEESRTCLIYRSD